MIWAFLGGLMLDMLLPERALGATTLALLVAVGAALLVARVTAPPRLIVIAATAFGVSWLYQVLLIALLALTAGIAHPCAVADHPGGLGRHRGGHRCVDRMGGQSPDPSLRIRRADRLVSAVVDVP